KHNMIDVRGPIMTNKDVIGLAIASSRYGSKAFQSGGIPPVALQGPFASGAAAQRASEDVANATIKLAREGRVANHDPEDIIRNMHSSRDTFYRSLKLFDRYGRGWTRRNDETLEAALAMI
ncbi:phage portal protein, partial [Paracoccaceae bacterium]|nr:phage portal protein [Paracoccaceae bacterium]